jgi:rhamnosyltransferase
MPPKISVVIPTLNAGPSFPELLRRIRSQKDVGDIEIVIVDSQSTDQTRQAARDAGAKVLKIRWQDFNHGDTRNLGIANSKGEYIALLTQDALPDNDQWLYFLVKALDDDPKVSAAYSRQIPHHDAPPWIKHQIEDYGVFSDQPRLQHLHNPASLQNLTPIERLRLCTLDNVSSLIRRSAWHNHPFPHVPFAEDLQWAKQEILRGGKISYQPQSRVIHSHRRGPIYEFRRARIAHYRLAQLFDIQLVPTFPLLIRYSLQNLAKMTKLVMSEKPVRVADLIQAPLIAVTSTWGQYIGAKIAYRQKGSI